MAAAKSIVRAFSRLIFCCLPSALNKKYLSKVMLATKNTTVLSEIFTFSHSSPTFFSQASLRHKKTQFETGIVQSLINFLSLNSKAIKMPFDRNNTLFLGDLSILCNEQEIIDAFICFGEIVEVKIKKSEEFRKNLSYGFIKFTTSQAAEKALIDMNGKVLRGRPLRLIV
jgi:hypothetical protein